MIQFIYPSPAAYHCRLAHRGTTVYLYIADINVLGVPQNSWLVPFLTLGRIWQLTISDTSWSCQTPFLDEPSFYNIGSLIAECSPSLSIFVIDVTKYWSFHTSHSIVNGLGHTFPYTAQLFARLEELLVQIIYTLKTRPITRHHLVAMFRWHCAHSMPTWWRTLEIEGKTS